jgi:hypothetical protein
MTKSSADFFTQIRPIWLGDFWTGEKINLFMIGADIRHFVFLANAEHTLKILLRLLSVSLTFFSVC